MISYLCMKVIGSHTSERFVVHASFALAFLFPTHNTESENTSTSVLKKTSYWWLQQRQIIPGFCLPVLLIEFHRILRQHLWSLEVWPAQFRIDDSPEFSWFFCRKLSNLSLYITNFEHTFWLMWSFNYFSSLLSVSNSIDGSPRNLSANIKSYSGSPRAVSAGFSVFTHTGLPRRTWRTLALISFLSWWSRLHWNRPGLFHLRGLFRNLPFSLFLAKSVVAHNIVGVLLHRDRLLSSLLIHPFILVDNVHGVALILPRLAHWRRSDTLSWKDEGTIKCLQDCVWCDIETKTV